jgi:Mn2+/Fe2+ NRAMP family transporter
MSLHVLYYGLIVVIVLIGANLLPLKQPLTLLTISGVLGGLTMALYVPFLLYLNNRRLPKLLRPGWLTNVALVLITIFYWYFSYRIIVAQFG